MDSVISRRRFVQGGAAAVGGGLAMGGPLAALAASTAGGRPPARDPGYGPLYPTREQDSGIAYLALPRGFRYRIVNRSGDPSLAFTSERERQVVPTPTYFDGMAAFEGPRGTTVLVRNHENRAATGRQDETGVIVPPGKAYDRNALYNAGCTLLTVGPDRRLRDLPLHVIGGTTTNCAGGPTPWGTWITCEEVFQPALAAGMADPDEEGRVGPSERHGYVFEVPSWADRPVDAEPVRAAGCLSHEAVAWHRGILYETEDRRGDAGFYRYLPGARIRRYGQLARTSGALQAIRRRGVRSFDADAAHPGETFAVDWVTIDDPDPAADTVRQQAQAEGAIAFNRLEGCWEGDGRIYFDATEGGEEGLGQLWEYDPRRELLTLVFESRSADVLENPDNLVVVPATGHVLLQEDSPGEQYVRGVTRRGRIYDVVRTLENETEFCGGCFSPDGRTFFLNQQGEAQAGTGEPGVAVDQAVTYAIWGPFEAAGRGRG